MGRDTLKAMDAIGPGPKPPEITDEDVTESQSRVRYLVVERLEKLWEPVEVRLQMEKDGTAPIDPRMLEIGLRTVKDLALRYRLDKQAPGAGEEEEDQLTGVDKAALIEAELQQLEARVKDQQTRHSGPDQGAGSGT